jgi:hypothetical protein
VPSWTYWNTWNISSQFRKLLVQLRIKYKRRSCKNILFSVRFKVLTAASMKMTVFWAIALMMEAASTSETSVTLYLTTRRNIPEDSHFHILFSFVRFRIAPRCFFVYRGATVELFLKKLYQTYRMSQKDVYTL